MAQERKSTGIGSAMRYSAIVAFLLLLLFVVLWVHFGLDIINLYNLLFGAIVFCAAMVTVSVFQAFRISESAHIIAHGMARDMLGASQELFTELYRKSPVPYILTDKTGVISSTNIAAIRLFGVNTGDLDGRNIFEFFETEDEQHVEFIAEKFTTGLSISDEEMQIKRKDGTYRWVLLSMFPTGKKDSNQRGFLTLVDITKQKEIDRAKSEFVSLASHQLRTPVTAVKWSLELFLEKSKDDISEDQMKYVSKMKSNVNRITALINDFLNVSKFELGTYVTDFTMVDLHKLIEDIIEENQHRIEKKQVVINKELDQAAEVFESDLSLLRMIIGNLVSNAIKYSHEHGHVGIRTVKNGHSLMIVVTDTGMGIPAEDQEMLFTKMFRARNARKDVPDGTGLGLYIVEYAARVLKGSINFESEEGRGTTFTVELPYR